MTKSHEPADTPAYDQVPTPWVNSTDILAVDVPTFAFSPGRLRAVRATNARSGKPIVSIRCGAVQVVGNAGKFWAEYGPPSSEPYWSSRP